MHINVEILSSILRFLKEAFSLTRPQPKPIPQLVNTSNTSNTLITINVHPPESKDLLGNGFSNNQRQGFSQKDDTELVKQLMKHQKPEDEIFYGPKKQKL